MTKFKYEKEIKKFWDRMHKHLNQSSQFQKKKNYKNTRYFKIQNLADKSFKI